MESKCICAPTGLLRDTHGFLIRTGWTLGSREARSTRNSGVGPSAHLSFMAENILKSTTDEVVSITNRNSAAGLNLEKANHSNCHIPDNNVE